MADRIRANRGAAGANVMGYLKVEASADPGCILVDCTPLELAKFDGWDWNRTNKGVLPSGGGSIIPTTASGPVTVTVSWDDNRTGAACATVPAPADCMSFVVEFIP